MSEPKHDCAFTVENDYFRFRAGGLLLKDGKILFVKTNFGDYYYVAGGGVKLGESTETGILREFTEEDASKVPPKNDEGEELVWIPVEKIPESNIKPNFIKNRIGEILNQTGPLHVVEETDRNN